MFFYLSNLQYSYEASVGEYEAQVSVVWNGDHYVGSLPVTLYKCDILGSHRDHPDCSLCVTRAKKYKCAWCGSVCAYSEACPVSAASECPRPRIDVVSPFSFSLFGENAVKYEGLFLTGFSGIRSSGGLRTHSASTTKRRFGCIVTLLHTDKRITLRKKKKRPQKFLYWII